MRSRTFKSGEMRLHYIDENINFGFRAVHFLFRNTEGIQLTYLLCLCL